MTLKKIKLPADLMEDLNPKKLIFNSVFYTVGILASIVITKFSDTVFPTEPEPVVFKKIVDTVKVVHEYTLTDNAELIPYKKSTTVKTTPAIAENDAPVRSERKSINESFYSEFTDLKTLFPKMKGYSTSGESSDFMFSCPKQDTKNDYVDADIILYDRKLSKKIACLYIIVKTEPKTLYSKHETIYEQAYTAHHGHNHIKIKNYLKNPNTVMEVGYFLTADSANKYPFFEKITCRSN